MSDVSADELWSWKIAGARTSSSASLRRGTRDALARVCTAAARAAGDVCARSYSFQ
jgi:hypothetical protein